jgi:hypothetical protein
VPDLMTELERFREWAKTFPEDRRNGEWECDYGSWGDIYNAVLEFMADHPFDEWSDQELRTVLYAIARDNDIQHLAREVRRRHPELLLPLSQAAIRVGERDDRWQLAAELGELGRADGEEEKLLLIMARDEHEYVRRICLRSLARLGSAAVEALALEAWHREDPDQEHARMMALDCLSVIGSPRLELLLVEAVKDKRKYLAEFARGILGNGRKGDAAALEKTRG